MSKILIIILAFAILPVVGGVVERAMNKMLKVRIVTQKKISIFFLKTWYYLYGTMLTLLFLHFMGAI